LKLPLFVLNATCIGLGDIDYTCTSKLHDSRNLYLEVSLHLRPFRKGKLLLNFTGVIVNFSCSLFEIGVECVVVVERTSLTVF